MASGWLLALYAVLAIVALVLAGKYLLVPLIRLVAKVSERELFIVTGLFAVCASAALMQAIGMSAALGAFVAGVMLAESPYRHELESDIDPFRSILLGLFFLAVGMMLDLDVIREQPLLIIGLAVALIFTKTAIIFGLGRIFGLATVPSIVMALLLSQGGEFGFVLFTAAQSAMLVEAEGSSIFGAVVTLSMAATPFLMILAGRLARERKNSDIVLEDPELAEQANAIIVGHGRFGQSVSQIMQAAGHSVTLIDIMPEQIDRSGSFGRKVFYGDGTRIDLLRRAGAEQACAIYFCIDDRDLDAETLEPIRESFPNAKLLVRAYDRQQHLALMPDAQLSITRELLESSIAMAQAGLVSLGFDAAQIERVVTEFRLRDSTRLNAQFESGNIRAGSEHSFGIADSADFQTD
jgi:glutathione-regulated potassium-efflux system protein KefB